MKVVEGWRKGAEVEAEEKEGRSGILAAFLELVSCGG